MSISVFLSTVTDEFRVYRDQLRADLTRHNVEVKVQEDFKGLGGDTLDKLDVYISHCDAVVHLVGGMTGAAPGERELQALLRKYPDLLTTLPPLHQAVRRGDDISYTQWEAWLALYHGKVLLTAKAEPAAVRGPAFAPTDQSRKAQAAHLGRLEAVRRYPDCTFESPADLAKHIAYTAILDLLVKDYANQAERASAVLQHAERGVSIAKGILKLITKLTNINDVRRWEHILNELGYLTNLQFILLVKAQLAGPKTRESEAWLQYVLREGEAILGKAQAIKSNIQSQRSKMIISAPDDLHQLLDLLEIRIQIWQFLLEAARTDNPNIQQAANTLCDKYYRIIECTREAADALAERLSKKDL